MAEDEDGCEGEFQGEISPKAKSLTLTAICHDCGRPIRMVTDDDPAIDVEDFLDGDNFRWEHDD